MKDLPPPHDMVDAIGNAYERMLERAIENTKKISDRTGAFMSEGSDVRTCTACRSPYAIAVGLRRWWTRPFQQRFVRSTIQYVVANADRFRRAGGGDPCGDHVGRRHL